MILVTGAAGLTGSAVIRELARLNVPVKALARRPFAAPPPVEVVEADMTRPGAALDGVDRALLISSSNERMVETQCAFIDAARQAGVRHVIKLSGAESGSGFDPQKFRFTWMHEQIERYLEASGLVWTHLRPSQFMQVYLREAPTIAAEGAMYLPLLDIKLAPIDVHDIAAIAARLLRDGGHASERFDMTGPEALSMAEIASRLSEALGKPVRYVNVSPEDRRRALLARGVPAAMVDAMEEQAAERRRRPESRVDVRAHRTFGVHPTTFAEFARREAAAFRLA